MQSARKQCQHRRQPPGDVGAIGRTDDIEQLGDKPVLLRMRLRRKQTRRPFAVEAVKVGQLRRPDHQTGRVEREPVPAADRVRRALREMRQPGRNEGAVAAAEREDPAADHENSVPFEADAEFGRIVRVQISDRPVGLAVRNAADGVEIPAGQRDRSMLKRQKWWFLLFF